MREECEVQVTFGGVEPGRAAAHRLGLANPHLALEDAARLGVELTNER